MPSNSNLNNTMRKWNAVYRALKSPSGRSLNNVMNNYEQAFNNAENNSASSNTRAAREHFEQNPNKRRYIAAAYDKLNKLRTPTKPKNKSPANSSKLKNAVKRAVVHNAVMTYVTNPSKLKNANYKYRYQQLIKSLHNSPINVREPLYRGVPKLARFMPAKGPYNSGGRLLSFAKKLNTAKFFARRGGTVYVLPPGKYPAFNINANVKKRYPNVIKLRNANKYPKLVRNYIGYARAEDEVLFAPGIFTVGNVRNNINKNNKIYKNIRFNSYAK